MTDLPENVDELVAEACGFTEESNPNEIGGYGIGCRSGEPFRPSTDPAAALFAMEAYAKKRFSNATVKFYTEMEPRRMRYECMIFDPVECTEVSGAFGDSWQDAICKAILAAEAKRCRK